MRVLFLIFGILYSLVNGATIKQDSLEKIKTAYISDWVLNCEKDKKVANCLDLGTKNIAILSPRVLGYVVENNLSKRFFEEQLKVGIEKKKLDGIEELPAYVFYKNFIIAQSLYASVMNLFETVSFKYNAQAVEKYEDVLGENIKKAKSGASQKEVDLAKATYDRLIGLLGEKYIKEVGSSTEALLQEDLVVNTGVSGVERDNYAVYNIKNYLKQTDVYILMGFSLVPLLELSVEKDLTSLKKLEGYLKN